MRMTGWPKEKMVGQYEELSEIRDSQGRNLGKCMQLNHLNIKDGQ